MRIAVTGGTGFIGRWFLRMYGDQYDCLVLGIEPDIDELVVDGKSFTFIRTDYSIGDLTEHLQSVDAVVHLAAKRPEANSLMSDYLENIKISSNLFEAARMLSVTNIVHMSSISVYSTEQTIPWLESCDVNPMSFYGISKLTIEKLSHYYNFNHNMKVKNLRLAQVVGVGEREGYMLSVFMKKAMNKQALTLWGKGKGRREYIYIKDVADAMDCALNKPGESGTFNIGMGKNTSHRELAELINEVFDNPGGITFSPDKTEDKSTFLMNITKAGIILGWQPKWELKDAFDDMKKLLNKHGNED